MHPLDVYNVSRFTKQCCDQRPPRARNRKRRPGLSFLLSLEHRTAGVFSLSHAARQGRSDFRDRNSVSFVAALGPLRDGATVFSSLRRLLSYRSAGEGEQWEGMKGEEEGWEAGELGECCCD